LSPSRSAVIQRSIENEYGPLIERISSSAAFRKAGRLKELLHYLAETSLHGNSAELTEQRIGQAVFGKPVGYSPVEDSSVRVHIRQLRLKLHEYFDSEGRDEAIVVTIPKGSYALAFELVPLMAPEIVPAPQIEPPPAQSSSWSVLPWLLVAGLTVLTVVLLFRQRTPAAERPLWPLSGVVANGYKTQVVLADATYGIERVLRNEPVSLEGYIKRDFQRFHPQNASEKEAFVTQLTANALLTSWADVAISEYFLRLAPDISKDVAIRSARDVQARELQQGNFVFVGSPAANPWVMLFENRLNFIEVRTDEASGLPKSFRNKNPKPGEQASYEGLPRTGFGGYDYAAVALLPGQSKRGNILIIQGLQQESTEAAGLMLIDEGGVQRLKKALNAKGDSTSPGYFEALLRTKALAGTASSVEIVATRAIQP